MKLTPIDVETQSFKVSWRGYDQDEVRAFLSRVSHELSMMQMNQQRLTEQINVQANQLEQVQNYEDQLRDALLSATQFGERAIDDAKREAELLVKEAEVRADQLLSDSRSELNRLREEALMIRRQRERFAIELRSIIDAHHRMLENLEASQDANISNAWSDLEPQRERVNLESGTEAIETAQALTLALSSGLSEDLDHREHPLSEESDVPMIDKDKSGTEHTQKNIQGEKRVKPLNPVLKNQILVDRIHPTTDLEESSSNSASLDSPQTPEVMPVNPQFASSLQAALSRSPKRVKEGVIATQAPTTSGPSSD